MKSFKEIQRKAAEMGPKKLAIAGPADEPLEWAVKTAKEMGIADAETFEDAAQAVDAVREGGCDVLMKGNVSTSDFMGAILDSEKGLRSGKLISHIAVMELGGRIILITDGGINLNPGFEDKVEIIKNAIPVANTLGIETPKVAVLAAVEKVNPKMPETVDAEKLSQMEIPGCEIQGPLAVDNAVSPGAAAAKGIHGPVAGKADILLVPSVLVGNIFAKGIMYFAGASFGGVVAGTSKPVTFLSRADTGDTKLNTISLGIISSQ